jgi:hypothetical protein
MKMKIPSVPIVLTIVLFGLLPKARAVVPPPDGGYPGFNTAEGTSALLSLTTGSANTAVGWFSLKSLTTGGFNTGVGAGTLLLNTSDANTAVGTAALLFNATGHDNTAVGAAALLDNGDGTSNTALGTFALQSNTDGNFNTAVGDSALFDNIDGLGNTACGANALHDNAIGNGNTANGQDALANNTSGDNNTALGVFAGLQQTTGSNSVYIGADMQGQSGESNACYIASIFGQSSPNGLQVVINSGNKLGTVPSSKRFKEAIKPMDKASEALFALKPVSFRYKKEIDSAGTSQLGLVAEDVEKVNPDLVVRNKEGKPYSVRYDQVNAMLLNEFLKEHRKVEKLEAAVAELAARLDRVSAQVQMNDCTAQVVANNH